MKIAKLLKYNTVDKEKIKDKLDPIKKEPK
jgi:hypothetical protein